VCLSRFTLDVTRTRRGRGPELSADLQVKSRRDSFVKKRGSDKGRENISLPLSLEEFLLGKGYSERRFPSIVGANVIGENLRFSP